MVKESYGLPALSRWTDVIETDPAMGWHAGQSYGEQPAEGLRCKKCGGTTFEVGRGDYWTGLRCPTCKYEVCVHEG
jgi:hypothetical protein